MAWWNEVLGLLRDEWSHLGEADHAPIDAASSLREAQKLLHRTTRELEEAQGRAEAARRRLRQARQSIEALAQAPEGRASYRERLTELASALTRESELVATFDAHIEKLSQLRDKIDAQLRQLDRDLDMMDAASGAAATVAQVGDRPRASKRSGKPGFRGKRSDDVMAALGKLSTTRSTAGKAKRAGGKSTKDAGNES